MAKGLRARQFRDPDNEDVVYRHFTHRKYLQTGLVAIGAGFATTLQVGAEAEAGSWFRTGFLISAFSFLIGFSALGVLYSNKLFNEKQKWKDLTIYVASAGAAVGWTACLITLFHEIVS